MIFFILLNFLSFDSSFSDIRLRSLSGTSSKKMELNSKKSRVFIVFQKNCPICRRQVKELKCLKSEAEVFLIGSFSNESELRKEYRLFDSSFAGFYGDHDFRKIFKIKENLTPQIILNQNSKYKIHLGFLSCDKILKKLKEGLSNEST